MSQSLLQGVLRPTGASQVDQIAAKLSNLNVPDDSPSSTRVSSPTPGSGSGRIPVTVSNVNSAIKSKRPSRGMESSSASSSDDDELVGVVSHFLFRASSRRHPMRPDNLENLIADYPPIRFPLYHNLTRPYL